MRKKRKLNVTVTMGPDSSRLITEALLSILDEHKEEFLQMLKDKKLKEEQA